MDAMMAEAEAHDVQGMIKMLWQQPVKCLKTPTQVRVEEYLVWGQQADAPTGGLALANEASKEGSFRRTGKWPDL